MALLHWSFCALCALSVATNSSSAAHGDEESPRKDSASGKRYTADWLSLDARPLPKWYDEAKFGIFVHWGVFSVPAYSWLAEWYWWFLQGQVWPPEGVPPDEQVATGSADTTAATTRRLDETTATTTPETPDWHRQMYGEGFKYQDFAASFQAKLWNPDDWAELFKKAGAQYVVLTSKHHEGFTLWPSKYSWNWNSMDVGPHRDLVGDLAKAVRAKGLTMGLYHSMFEWFHPLFLEDRKNRYTTRNFPTSKTLPELREIVEKYKPDIVWSDGEWEADTKYWGSKEFLAWLFNDSPVKDTVVVNDRWGNETRLKHGSFFSGEDRQTASAKLLGHKWESCMTVDGMSWGYNRVTPLSGFLSATDILRQLSSTVAYGGNLLLNVGPTADGIIPPIYQERLTQVGDFLKINGDAVYGTRPCKVQNETGIEGAYYTVNHEKQMLYLTVIQSSGYWPRPGSTLELRAVKTASTVELLTSNGPYAVECTDTSLHVQCTMPSAYDVGLVDGAVNPLGFVLRLKDALVDEVGVDLAPFMGADEIHA